MIDSSDLLNSLSTQKDSVDSFIKGDVVSIRYVYEVGHVNEVLYIRRKIDLANPLAKNDSSLTDASVLIMMDGRFYIYFEDYFEKRNNEKNLG